jgi:hypothetical protein
MHRIARTFRQALRPRSSRTQTRESHPNFWMYLP